MLGIVGVDSVIIAVDVYNPNVIRNNITAFEPILDQVYSVYHSVTSWFGFIISHLILTHHLQHLLQILIGVNTIPVDQTPLAGLDQGGVDNTTGVNIFL